VGEEFKKDSTVSTVFIGADNAPDLQIRINVSCHNLKLQSFWGGEWLSTWDVLHTLGSDSFQLVGKIRVKNHYFEQGNIQFDLRKNYPEALSGQSVNGSLAAGVVQLIKTNEEEYQKSLESMYEELSENHIRNLRRKLPFTGQKFEWSVPKLM